MEAAERGKIGVACGTVGVWRPSGSWGVGWGLSFSVGDVRVKLGQSSE